MTTVLRRATPSVIVLVALAGFACGSGRSRVSSTEEGVVTSADIDRSAGKPIERVLQEKVTGVTVSRANDGGIAVQIRGGGSLTGNDAPLYILDGLPFQPGPGGALSGVDPYSIESIRVVKGPEAVIYGARGFNGVIVITTKNPQRR